MVSNGAFQAPRLGSIPSRCIDTLILFCSFFTNGPPFTFLAIALFPARPRNNTHSFSIEKAIHSTILSSKTKHIKQVTKHSTPSYENILIEREQRNKEITQKQYIQMGPKEKCRKKTKRKDEQNYKEENGGRWRS